jgi:hypothetical protein
MSRYIVKVTNLEMSIRLITHPGHKIPRPEPKIPNFGTLFGYYFLEIEFTLVNLVLYLGEPKLSKYAEFECSYIINITIF